MIKQLASCRRIVAAPLLTSRSPAWCSWIKGRHCHNVTQYSSPRYLTYCSISFYYNRNYRFVGRFFWKLKFYVNYVLQISVNLYISLRRLLSVFPMIKWPRAERNVFNLVSFAQHLYNSICHFHMASSMYNTLNGVESGTGSLLNSTKRPMKLMRRCNFNRISHVMLAATSSGLRRSNKFSISARCLQQASLSCSFTFLEENVIDFKWELIKWWRAVETNTYDIIEPASKNNSNIWFHNIPVAIFGPL
jgi:hypothetical protein